MPAVLAAALALASRAACGRSGIARPRPSSRSHSRSAISRSRCARSTTARCSPAGPITDAEQYTYSAVWLAFGVALLALGMWLRSQPVRYASAAVVVLTVLKVFLIDMADLQGLYQALSFIGLGVVLLGIARLYQRLLFPRRAPAAEARE